jgi:hypothetical protein
MARAHRRPRTGPYFPHKKFVQRGVMTPANTRDGQRNTVYQLFLNTEGVRGHTSGDP